MPCPLCCHQLVSHYHADKKRDYWQCNCCQLVFVNEAQRLLPDAEKAIYDLHQNSHTDEGYLRFLSRFAEPLKQRLKQGAKGLDYGCGPAPVLANMLSESGFPTIGYDPFYLPAAPTGTFDFICCTEAIEHFYQPGEVLKLWLTLMAPQATLGIMTKRVINKERFANWHYKNDQTHVCFFSEATFTWIAQQYSLRLEIAGPDVVFLYRDKV
ncbi:methyltransferase domain-containing protein [Bowmanella sp. Y26]|uniref:Class I SAM-dependent methyltransferase n=1 Tax=Bowmanella yangjiangensis TaxID=2811230 RepID=A0ABS3CXJ5_9ALTE|nr:class I SAM-dependent methyltransferase [Bowmanella yangjiangensis]MBN7821841.1 class I SAM-dependent methyltransferase [Bowmanella yangjiangensis]MBT1063833.1 methyltransferase domain-containing protein [Bowmanella yangjiangensis]